MLMPWGAADAGSHICRGVVDSKDSKVQPMIEIEVKAPPHITNARLQSLHMHVVKVQDVKNLVVSTKAGSVLELCEFCLPFLDLECLSMHA